MKFTNEIHEAIASALHEAVASSTPQLIHLTDQLDLRLYIPPHKTAMQIALLTYQPDSRDLLTQELFASICATWPGLDKRPHVAQTDEGWVAQWGLIADRPPGEPAGWLAKVEHEADLLTAEQKRLHSEGDHEGAKVIAAKRDDLYRKAEIHHDTFLVGRNIFGSLIGRFSL